MTYHFDEIVDRRGTNCVKYDAAAQLFNSEDVLPLWIADSDFPAAPFIIQALRERTEHPVFGYSFHGPEFEQVVKEWVGRRNGWEIQPEWIGFSPGVVAGFSLAIRALSEAGDGVLIQPPVYPPFAKMIRMNERNLLNNPLVWDGEKYAVDFEDFEKKAAQAKVFLMCNPHNPTGRVFSRDELLRMGEICVKHNVYIISDEIHSDLIIKPNRHLHIASLSDEIARRTITFISPSKTFNVAGLTSSVTIIPDDSVRRKFNRQIELCDASHGNIFGTVALIAAYRQGDEWLDGFMGQMERNARFVVDALRERVPSVKAYVPESTFLLWLDFREWGLTQPELFRLLVDTGLGLSDGSDFGAEGVGFMRVNIATSMSILEKVVELLEKADKIR